MRFGPSGALDANEYNGKVNVNNWNAENLAVPLDNHGGRATDMAKKTQHRVLYTALGVVILRIESNFLSRGLSPDAEHVSDFLQALLPVDISVGLINAAIMNEANEELYKIEYALETIKQYHALGQGECVRLPKSVNQGEDAGFDRLAECMAFGFRKFIAVRVDNFIKIITFMHQTELFSTDIAKPAVEAVGGGGVHRLFERVIGLENLFFAWENFRRGKMRKADVLLFSAYCEDDVFTLYNILTRGAYHHSPYEQFYVHDPKRRHISKAIVNDRVVHQAIVQIIEPMVDGSFIFDSYASRAGKGTHAAIARFSGFLRRASRNNRRTVFVLKCDIRKFFDSIRHDILLDLLARIVRDERLLALCAEIVESYTSHAGVGRGVPLGNVTSQLFANIYLNAFDHFVKERLGIRWYVRFCDDFLIADGDRARLEALIPQIQEFLSVRCGLTLHPKKVTIRKFSQGIDVLGTVLRPYVQTIRTNTKRRMFRRLRERMLLYQEGRMTPEQLRATIQSYRGLLHHGTNVRVREQVRAAVLAMLVGREI